MDISIFQILLFATIGISIGIIIFAHLHLRNFNRRMDLRLNSVKEIFEQDRDFEEIKEDKITNIYDLFRINRLNKRKINYIIIESEENEMSKKFIYYVASSCPIMWVDAIEYERAINKLSQQCIKNLNSKCFKWDIVNGIFNINKQTIETKTDTTPQQPLLFLKNCKGENNIIFVQDYHLFLNNSIDSINIWRDLINSIDDFKSKNNIFVIVSPSKQMIPEIKRYVTIVDFELPDKKELSSKLEEQIKESEFKMSETEKEEIVNCGLGLTEFEFENAMALSMARNEGKVEAKYIYEQKEQLIKNNSNLEICKFNSGFESLAGLDNLKDFTKKMVESKDGRGVLLLGVPGTGKSHFAKCLGKETNRITITMNFGDLMGSLVGETERKTKEALKIIDAMSPCVLFIDEIEKGLAGTSGHNGDSGTSQRQGGQFLTWLNDHSSDVYIVATANDIGNLPPAFLRAERWDAIFFVDLPNETERNAIFQLYKEQYKIEDESNPNIENWTGAEIKTLCRLTSNLKISLEETKKYVVPIFQSAEEKVDKLREWAKLRTIPASREIKSDIQTESKRNILKLEEVS